jgi:hypothetical protein
MLDRICIFLPQTVKKGLALRKLIESLKFPSPRICWYNYTHCVAQSEHRTEAVAPPSLFRTQSKIKLTEFMGSFFFFLCHLTNQQSGKEIVIQCPRTKAPYLMLTSDTWDLQG